MPAAALRIERRRPAANPQLVCCHPIMAHNGGGPGVATGRFGTSGRWTPHAMLPSIWMESMELALINDRAYGAAQRSRLSEKAEKRGRDADWNI